MQPILTTSQMRAIDGEAIAGNVDVGYGYMLKAGQGLYDTVVSMIRDKAGQQIAIVCGKGNNGGDGYVLGKMLIDNGYKPMCFGLCEGEELRGEARRAYDEYIESAGNFLHIDDAQDLENFAAYALIVDAILGTGIKGNPRGVAAEIIEIMNFCGKPVLAVDTPSGLDNDTGARGKPTVCAEATVTMGYAKIGQLFYPGRKNVGRLIIKELGYPSEILAENSDSVFLPTKQTLASMLPPRRPDGSKFDHGLAFLLCASRGMTGSATLAAQSALRTGCGMVHCAAPQSVVETLSVKLTETVIHPVDQTDEGTASGDAMHAIVKMADSMQAALVGPGLSHHPETSRLVRDVVSKTKVPVILDADGINAYKGCGEALENHAADLVITPHGGEWARLFETLPDNPSSRVKALCEKAAQLQATILYKGNPTIVAGARGESYIIAAGNSALASAGSGDVLSGIIVSLMAQGACGFDAAVLGASVHGLAGAAACAQLNEYSVIASDIVKHIPHVVGMLAPPAPPPLLPDK